MNLVKFLNAIPTPQIQTQSLHGALAGKVSQNKDRDKNRERDGECTCQKSGSEMKKVFSLHARGGGREGNRGILEVEAPFYVERGAKVMIKNGQCPCCQGKASGQGIHSIKLQEFMKKGVNGSATLDFRMKLGRQKRNFIRNYERHTYQPPKTTHTPAQDPSLLRKHYAMASQVHKFCTTMHIPCPGCKCKLDCINQSFEQFLRNADLCILKGLNRIVGRGMNLDAEIKAEIMGLYADRHHKEELGAIMEKIKGRLAGKFDKHHLKRYLNWAKEIINIAEKIESYHHKKKLRIQATKSMNNTIDLNLQQSVMNTNYIASKGKPGKSVNNRKTNKKSNQKQFKKMKTVKKPIQILSIRGSRIESYQNMPPQQTSLQESSNESICEFVQKTRKLRLKKFNSINHSSKRKLKSLIPHYNNQTFQKQLSRFYDQDLGLGLDASVDGKMADEKKDEQEGKGLESESSFQAEPEDIIEQRLNLFENIMSKINIQDKIENQDHQEGQDLIQDQQQSKQKQEQKQNLQPAPQFSQTQPVPTPVKTQTPQATQLLQNLKRKREVRKSPKATNLHQNTLKSHLLNKNIKKGRQPTIEVSVDEINNFSLNVSHNGKSNKSSMYKIMQSQKSIRSKKKLRKNGYKFSGLYEAEVDVLECENKQEALRQITQTNIKAIMRQISSTTCLIEKVQKTLTSLGLESAILSQADSILTQKRKIRHIRQLVDLKFVRESGDDILRYLDIFAKRTRLRKLGEMLEDCGGLLGEEQEEELGVLLRRYRDLKFIALKDTSAAFVGKKKVKIQQKQPQVSVNPVECHLSTMIKPPEQPTEKNKKFLGSFQTFITEKQHTPFDFYHYLELGNNIALRKYYYQNRCGLKGQQSRYNGILNQKRIGADERNDSLYA